MNSESSQSWFDIIRDWKKKKNDFLIYSQKTVNLSHQSKPISDIIMYTIFSLKFIIWSESDTVYGPYWLQKHIFH